MRAERHHDLVPPLAIVVGAVVGAVVTFLAFYTGGDEVGISAVEAEDFVVSAQRAPAPPAPALPAPGGSS